MKLAERIETGHRKRRDRLSVTVDEEVQSRDRRPRVETPAADEHGGTPADGDRAGERDVEVDVEPGPGGRGPVGGAVVGDDGQLGL